MERIDFVNDKLSLIQKTDGLTFGTDALLLASYINGRFPSGLELGGGTGIISMLLLTREKLRCTTVIEVQEEYAELIARNGELNSLSDRMAVEHCDLQEFKSEKSFDIIYTNPPYMKVDSGKSNMLDKKNIARHEVKGTIDDFCAAGKRLLKYGGAFYAVYRPDRAADIIFALKAARLEPKRMTFVHADAVSEPSMMLIEAKLGAKSGMKVTRPLIIYKDKEHREYSEDMDFIMENGSFPDGYKR